MAWLPLAIAGAASARTAEAQGPPPEPISARSARGTPARLATPSFSLTEQIPSSTPVAVIIQTPMRFMERVQTHAASLRSDWSALGERAILAGLEQALGGPPDAGRWRAAGIEVDRPVLIVPRLGGGSALVRFGLSDRRRFEAWLGRMVGDDRTSLSVGRERAIVLFPDSELPIICLLRLDHAFCQFGVAGDDEPAADLRALITGAWKPLSARPGLAQRLATLDADADAYVIVQPPQIAGSAQAAWLEHARRSLRFHHGRQKHQAARVAKQRAEQLGSILRHGQFALAAIGLDRSGPRVEIEIDLDQAGARWLATRIRPPRATDSIRAWASTPALARISLNLSEDAAQELVSALGLPVAPERVDGRIAGLALGIDSECSAAKTEVSDPASYLVMMPFAAAVGLRTLDAGESTMSAPPAWLGSVPWQASKEAQVWHGEHLGSPIEARIHDRVLLLGAGHGAAQAAERRWVASQTRAEEASEHDAFLEADVDLGAVRAALASARLGPSSRGELQQLDRANQQWSRWLEPYRSIALRAKGADEGQRVRIELGFRH